MSLHEIFSDAAFREEGYSNRTFEEVNLPFEDISADYIEGEQLLDAMTSSSVKEELSDYVIHSVQNGGDYEFRALNDQSWLSSSGTGYIAFEGRLDGEYSHLRVELAASNEEGMDSLYSDLEAFEDGLEGYFSQEDTSTVGEVVSQPVH